MQEKPWLTEKTLSSRYIYRGRVVNLRQDTVTSPGGPLKREIVEHAECIVVVPLTGNHSLYMVRQFRKPVEKFLLELPAGGIEDGETPEEAVKRELQEEIGFLPRKLRYIGGFYSAPGFCTEYLHLFMAEDLKMSRGTAEDTHEIEVVEVSLSEVPRLIKKGEIEDAKSIVGLLRVITEKRRGGQHLA